MAKNSIGEPVPVADDESVYSKWSAIQGKKDKKGDSQFLPMTTVNNITKKVVNKDKTGNGGKGNNNNNNNGGNKGNGGNNGGNKGGGKGGFTPSSPRK